MPQGNQSRRKHRANAPVTQASQVTEVTARPVDTYVAPSSQKSQLLEAIEALQPSANLYTQKMKDRDAQQAEAQRLGMSADEAAKFIDSDEFQTKDIAYRRSFMLNHGKMDGRAYRDNIVAGYDTDFNPEQESLEDFKKRYVPSPRSQDADYLAGFNGYAGEGITAVDGAYNKFQIGKANEETDTAVYQDALEFIQDAAAQNRTINPTELQILKDNAEILGKSKKETEVLTLKAVDSLAVGGYPELYDIFYEKRADGSPGIAHTPEYGEYIAKARAHAMRVKLSNAAKEDEAVKFEARMNLHDKAQNGQLTRHYAKGFVDTLGASTVASFVEESEKRAREIAEFEAMKLDVRKGNGLIHKDNKDYKKAVDDVSRELLQDAGNDPVKQNMAISRVVDLGIKSGQLYSPWESTLKGTNPLNPTQFTQSAFLYRNIQAANPAYASKLLPESQRVLFDTYQLAMDNQASQDQALALAQRIGTPEAEKEANAFLQGAAGRELIASIDEELTSELSDDTANASYIRSAVRDKVNLRIRMGMNPEAAKTSAIEDFKNTHMEVKGRYVRIGRNPLTDGMVDAAEEYLDDLPARRLAAGLDVDEEGYHIMHDAKTDIDGTYGVYDSHGVGIQRRVSLKGIIAANRKKLAEENKAEAIADQKKRIQREIEYQQLDDTLVP